MSVLNPLTPTEAYILLGSMFSVLISLFFFVTVWYKKNNILLSINEYEGSVNISSSYRVRKVNKKVRRYKFFGKVLSSKTYLHKLNDFFTRKPLDIDYDKVKNSVIVVESMPLIGVKYILNLVRKPVMVNVCTDFDNISPNKLRGLVFEGKAMLQAKLYDKFYYQAWGVPTKLDKKGLINNIRMVNINTLREELYESTDNTTKGEMLAKVVVPVALIVLALSLLVFFPKIYEAIMKTSLQALNSASINWEDTLSKVKPLG